MMAAAALCLGCAAFVSCKKDDDGKTMTFSSAKVEIGVGANKAVTVTNCTTPLTVKSSDEKVATVKADNSTITITGVATGSATVSVVDANKQAGSISVTVKEVLSLDNSSLTVKAGAEGTINIKSGTAPYTVAVADSKIATASVKDAVITVKGVAKGSTTITVTDSKKVTGVASISVSE